MLDGANVSLDTDAGSFIDGRYRIESLVGRGGMSEVYRATDEKLHRTVAVKLFRREAGEPADLERAASEVKLLASLSHYALVTVFDARIASPTNGGYGYLVMELVAGENLRERIDRGPISPHDAAAMLCDIAEALHVVHSAGVVHRDIKPANLLLSASPLPDREFSVKLADFGIAYMADSIGLTSTGAVIGTAAYLSPEQAHGERPRPATDIYALGLVLLEALTGVRAFPGSLVESASARVLRDPVIPGSLGYEWKKLLTAMTARDPLLRPAALEVALAARSLNELPSSTPLPSTSPTDEPTRPISQIATATALMTPSDFTVSGTPNDPDSRTTVMDLETTATPNTPVASTATTVIDAPRDVTVAGDVQLEASQVFDRDSDQARKWPRVVSIASGVLILAVVTVFLLSTLSSGDIPPPELPAVDGPLGTHLQQLLESVIP